MTTKPIKNNFSEKEFQIAIQAIVEGKETLLQRLSALDNYFTMLQEEKFRFLSSLGLERPEDLSKPDIQQKMSDKSKVMRTLMDPIVDYLIAEYTKTTDNEYQLFLIQALGFLGGKKTISFLNELLQQSAMAELKQYNIYEVLYYISPRTVQGIFFSLSERLVEEIIAEAQEKTWKRDFHKVLKHFGEKHMKLNDKKTALAFFQKGVEAYPESFIPWFDLGAFYSQVKKQKQALKYYLQANQRNPNNSIILLNIGNCYLELNKPKKAFETLKRAAELDPNNQGILMLLYKASTMMKK